MSANHIFLNFEDKSLQAFFDASNQSMWITDCRFEAVLAVNEAGAQYLGYQKDAFFLQPVESILPLTGQQKLIKLADASFTAQKSLKKEICLIHASGKKRYAEVTVSAVLFNGTEARLLTMTDVTEKKLYRNMLEDSIDLELVLKARNKQLHSIALVNFHRARKPLANILGLVNVMDQSVVQDKTLSEAIEFLRESGNELDELIKNIDPQQF